MTDRTFRARLAELGINAAPWPSDQYPIGVVHMTPALAQQLLDRTEPRRLGYTQPSLVEAYVKQMHAGEWRYTGDTIKFRAPVDDTDLLIQEDGTHRLTAIVTAGWSGPLAIALGLPPEAAWAMDPPGTASAARGSRPPIW